MIIKEKIIFWSLVAGLAAIVIFGFTSQGNKKVALEELMQDIELATKKSKARIKEERDKWDFAKMKAVDEIGGYELLLKRSPFFRVRPEEKIKKAEPIPIKEPPKKAVLKYKGKVTMGAKVMVIIEDQGTGKSSFVQEGDMVGDFLVSSIDENYVVLKKKGGEELILSVAKKEEREKTSVDDKKTESKVK
ncbi:MAG: hypothetical protein KKD90_01515 [Candidatus Omnitrophica bacterium]|nr:hypothetical protein [Candidatus Omnitrophota bacterium]MBU4149300.1 hypothetical protein [Candidatus Omnitrophota bacterium]